MKNIKKRLIGWTLGLALSLGVGIGIASNTHSEITGVEATSIASVDVSERAKTLGWTNGKPYSGWTDSNGIFTFSQSGGGNNGKYYSSDNTWRFYKDGGKSIISCSTEYVIEKVSSNPSKSWVINANKTEATFSATATTAFKSFQIEYSAAVVKAPTEITLSGQTTEYFVGQKFTFTGACTAKFDDGSTQEVEPTTVSEPDMSTVGQKTVEVSYTAGGTTKTASYTINVIEPSFTGDGTKDNPFTVADAIKKATIAGGTATADSYFVKGKIAKIDTPFNSQFGNMTFSVSEDGTTANVFKFFRCVADKNVKFTSDSSKTIVVGEEILGCGKILSYNGTPEFDAGCYPYDYKATSISATEPTASGWKVGDTISSVSDLGITVTADIEITGEKRDVTAEATVEPVTLADGENTITVKYTQINKYSGVTTNNTPLTTTVIANVTTTEATDMAIVTGSTTIYAGETTTLKATLSGGTNNYQRTIGWTSSDTAVIANPENSVDGAEFVITGLKEGTTTLTGTVVAPGSATASVTITVKPARTETDIALHGKMLKTEYNVGDAWDLTGLDLEVSWSDGDPTYLSLDDENVVYECNPVTVNDANLTSFSLEVIFGTLDKTFVVDGFNVVVKSYASLVTSPKDLWDGQEIYFASTAEATKVSALHAGGNNLKSVDGTYVKDKGLSIDDTANAKAYTVGRVELEGTTYYTFSFMSETGIKYLADTGTSSKNTLQLSDEIIDTASSCVYFTISVSTTDGTATIKSKSNTAKSYLMWNEGSDLFSCYSGGQKNPYLFAVTPYSETTVTNSFVDRYLHMDENVDGQCKTYYPVLKSVWAAMSIDEKLSIEATAQDRLEAWATANGEQLDSGMNLVSNANFIIKGSEIKDGDAFALIAVVSMVSATAIGSFLFIRKRKEQN